MNSYIGIDLGTSSVKILLVAADGTLLSSASAEYPLSHPCTGWSEQEPQAWYTATLTAMTAVLQGQDRAAVKGIGIAGQMHGLVLLDEAGEVIRPCILWNDGRSAEQATRLNQELGFEELTRRTGNIAFAGFTAPKLLWVRENEPENFSRIAHILLPKEYLLYRLTGAFATEPSDAAGTLYYDTAHGRWSEEMLELCGIDRAWLPKITRSDAAVGTLKPELAARFGLCEDVIFAAGGGDNAAAAIGVGAVGEGMCCISVGTSGTVMLPSKAFRTDPANALHSFAHANGSFLQLGCILSAASCGKWWIEDILNGEYEREQADITAQACAAPLFLPYLAGERSPHNDASARGLFFGLCADTTRAQMTRAVYEGVSFALCDCIEAARKMGICPSRAILCGGGVKTPFWGQMLSNILQIEIALPAVEQGPGLGGAVLAAVASGEFASVEDAKPMQTKIREILSPQSGEIQTYAEKYALYRKLYPAVRELYAAFSD